MHCSRIRTALSARLDGEELPPGVTPGRLDDHLAGCRDCRRWDARARALTAGLDRAAGYPEGDPAAADALLARLRSAAAGPGTTGSGTADTGGKRAG
ncbi:zf-HC2 domain-containing protein [Streptomyces caniferus]|uniref:zf-HC2 domain-containing protein n=1 Tax=Streptomyces caniferus TaxID=285557 RepID=UPI003454E353